MRKDIKQLFTELIINPAIPFWGLLRRVSPLITSDIIYIKIAYYIKFGRRLNIKRPETFNEKLQWLKINYRKQFFTDMADKYSAKQYAERIIGKQYIVPCYGIWTQAEQIDFDTLPNTFVLKCTHNSGAGTFICKDKNNINVFKIQKDLKKALKTNHYYL